MQTVVLTLFGESYIPEPVVPRRNRETHSVKKKEKTKKNTKEITILQDWIAEKNYYSIGEVADFFKVRTSHIRFWAKEFSMKVRTNKKGDRLFTPDHIQEFRMIYHLVKECGYTLTGAKIKLKEDRKKLKNTLSLKESLLTLRRQLTAIRDKIAES